MTTRISSNGGFNFNNLAPNLTTDQTAASPKITGEKQASQTTPINNPNDLLAARLGTNYKTQRFKLETHLIAQTNSDSDVPADVTTDGKTVAFKDAQLAQDQLNVLKRYVVDNNLLPGAWVSVK